MLGIPRQSLRAKRGFSLVELMAVVAITSVLALLGVIIVRRHLKAATTGDALAGMQAIRVAEESFRAENGQYLNCSVASGPAWFPNQTPNKYLFTWRQEGHPDWTQWKVLAIPRTETRFGYLVNAGIPGAALPTFNIKRTVVTVPPTEPWYVIQVKGDRDGDGEAMLGLASSFDGQVYIESDDE
jgi:prepilin-type N-terminal cleavage/methylation domain-containing protein